MRFALRRQTEFPHLNLQAKKATLSFYRVIGILLSVLVLFVAPRQHHSAVEKPRRLCCTLAYCGPIWAKMGLLSGGALEAVLHIEKHPLCVRGTPLGAS